MPSDELDGGVELPTELKFSKNKEDSEHSEESDRIVDKSASLPIQPIRPAPIPPARPSTPPSRPKPPLNSTIQQNVNQVLFCFCFCLKINFFFNFIIINIIIIFYLNYKCYNYKYY